MGPEGRIWTASSNDFGYFAAAAEGTNLEYHSLIKKLPPEMQDVGHGGFLVTH